MEKRSKWRKLKRVLAFTGIALMMLVTGLWLFSPYRHHPGFDYKLVKHSVVINAPADSVFRFLGNSGNAAKWSVYVNHISPLNRQEVPDGKPGSRRRCYCYANEKGTQWDEVITQVEPNKKRQISCYNLVDFWVSTEGLGTEQLYKPLGENKCELTFTVFFLNKRPTFWDEFKTSLAAYRIKSIFAKNMDNIKRMIETGK